MSKESNDLENQFGYERFDEDQIDPKIRNQHEFKPRYILFSGVVGIFLLSLIIHYIHIH